MTDERDTMRWTAPVVRAAALEKQRGSIWNADQLATVLLAAGLAPGARLLDVGAGSGGMLEPFGDLLAAHPGATLTCLDREASFSVATAEKARALGLADRVTAITGDAAALPLADNEVDIAFCQTVLMHAAEPARIVAEMARVVRPGGALVIVEGNAMIRPNLLTRVEPELAVAILQLWHRIRIGRRMLGRGDLAVGEELPSMLAAAGVALTEVRLVDRARATGPAAPTAWRAEQISMFERAGPVFAMWRPGFAEAFVAAGGTSGEFDRLWDVWRGAEEAELEAVRGHASRVLVGLLYVFVGHVSP